jgi:hypothetical protein
LLAASLLASFTCTYFAPYTKNVTQRGAFQFFNFCNTSQIRNDEEVVDSIVKSFFYIRLTF